ncbi:MAG: hypothetical protein ABI407_03790 [Bradyrhizobium sp.]
MKKPPKLKHQKKPSRLPSQLSEPNNLGSKTIEEEPKSSHTQPTGKEKFRSLLWWGWKEFWAFAGPLISVVGLYFWLRPQITVEPSVNLDPSQTLSTQLLIKNVGHVPIYNVRFGFALGGGHVYIGRMTRGDNLKPIALLSAGTAVTRALASESIDVQAPDVILNVTYVWPIIGKETTVPFHFSIKRGAAGFFLVPDLPT